MAKNTKKSKKTKHNNINLFCKILIWTLIIVSGLVFSLLKLLNVIPNDYIIIALCFFIITDCLLIIGILIKNNVRIFSSIVSTILIILYILIIIYELYTYFFLNNINNKKNISTENYSIVVLNSSNLNSIEDIQNKDLGILDIDDEGYIKALTKLAKKITTNNQKFSDSTTLAANLLDNNIPAILIDDSTNALLEENFESYSLKTKVIYSFSIEVAIADITKTKNVTKDTFNIYISGIDTYGKITSNARSDVNIIATINPVENKVHLTHIPRDYYVTLYNKKSKDKLTHAGIYGIDTSVKTIEALLDTEINYYVKLNFTSIIDIVNALGSIEVYSDYTFTSGIYDDKMTQTYNFYKGKNTLNGDETLAFVRERHAFSDGDRVRGMNQMKVIEALIKKCTSPSILTNYPKLLKALSNSFVTNISDDDLTKLIKKQLEDNQSWTVTSYELDGSNGFEYTYSYPRQKLFVLVPKEDSLQEAKNQINSLI